ncbi:unnamed protein product [Dicrocoelium dendriticum]|nr:unnamed protein product [Dicrocoelium dendriticum]
MHHQHHLEGDSSAHHSSQPTESSSDHDQSLLRTTLRSIHLHPLVSATEPLDHFFDKIEAVLLKYPRDPGRTYGKPVHMRPKPIHLSRSECLRVWQQYFAIRNTPVPDATRHSLTLHTFNHWPHSDAQLLAYLRLMFIDLDLPTKCNFPLEVLDAWLLALYRRYNNVPFHNFKHAFAVTQMMYSIIKQAELPSFFSAHELLALLFSAVSHDLDHPGFTNSYQVNVGSWLALRYNDNSPLENHHCAVAFDLISCPYTNILCGLDPSELRWFRKAVIRCILSTDMSCHADCMEHFRQMLRGQKARGASASPCLQAGVLDSGFDWDGSALRQRLNSDPEARITVMFILLKVCDLSNEVRPPAVADPWLDCLLDEFFYQARAERRLGLPVAPNMDPDKITRCDSQIAFLTDWLLPLLDDVVAVFPKLKPLLVGAQARVQYFQSPSTQSSQQTDLIATCPSAHEHLPPPMSNPAPSTSDHIFQCVAPLAHLKDGRPQPHGSTSGLSAALEPVATTSSGTRVSVVGACIPQPDETTPKFTSASLLSSTLSEDASIPLPPKDLSGNKQSRRHSSQPAFIGTPNNTATLLCTGFSGPECDFAPNPDMLAEDAPSRKSSTGSMVLASS